MDAESRTAGRRADHAEGHLGHARKSADRIRSAGHGNASPPPACHPARRQAAEGRSPQRPSGFASMNMLKTSWSSFTRDIAKIYLNGFGYPSPRSKVLVASVLREIFADRRFTIADFGCGNGHLAEFFREQGLNLAYHGYDFSTSLLQAGREQFEGRADTRFFEADIENPDLRIEPCDVVLFSHVLEMLQSPQKSLLAAKRNAPLVLVRFFEPPDGDLDVTQLLQMNVGGESTVPYLRRMMSAGYYNLILTEIGCHSVEVHQVDGDKDQVHLLRFSPATAT
jgi:hypothetical protein